VKVEARHLENIARAQRHYSDCGFVNVDLPWSVATPYIDATIPPDAVPLYDMVGSGEQSLIAKFDPKWGDFVNGRYQCVTPCFRPGDRDRSECHLPEFLKLELMAISSDREPNYPLLLAYVVTPVIRFMKKADLTVELVNTSQTSWDLMGQKNGVWVELGSYGWRTVALPFGVRTWYYGTGIAEPRFSQVLT